MTVHQHKQDKNLIVCSECAESHTIDLNDYNESPFSECSICGYVDEKARDWEDVQAPVVELVYTTDLKSVADYGMLVRVQPGAPMEGCSVNGSTAVSKTASQGSNPCTSAKLL